MNKNIAGWSRGSLAVSLSEGRWFESTSRIWIPRRLVKSFLALIRRELLSSLSLVSDRGISIACRCNLLSQPDVLKTLVSVPKFWLSFLSGVMRT